MVFRILSTSFLFIQKAFSITISIQFTIIKYIDVNYNITVSFLSNSISVVSLFDIGFGGNLVAGVCNYYLFDGPFDDPFYLEELPFSVPTSLSSSKYLLDYAYPTE